MVKYTFAALAILSTAKLGLALAPSCSAFVSSLALSHSNRVVRPNFNSRRYSAIPYDSEFAENDGEGNVLGSPFPSATSLLDIPDDDNDEVEAILRKKEERRVARLQRTRQRSNYQITLPLSGYLVQPPPMPAGDETNGEALASLVAKGQEIAVANSIGMSLRQVYSGRKLSELALDVDTLLFQSFVDELRGRRVDAEGDDSVYGDAAETTEANGIGSVQVLQNTALETLAGSFDGVVVSSVARGGLAWTAGVRAGDVLTATSATMGRKLWPKSTLDGIRSAMSSRKIMSNTMDFEFKRLLLDEVNGAEEGVTSFELSLSRPIGINVEDTDDGFVTITGISGKASPVVKENLRIGDRVLSVESSVGAQMWDVFTTDALTSAVTSRMPGQPVRILFERFDEIEDIAEETFGEQSLEAEAAPISYAVVGFRQAGESVATSAESAPAATLTAQAATQTAAQKMLLSRSRDLLRTYIARNEVTKNVKVADRVLEAVMDAEAILNGKTLNLIMKAYNTCNNAEKAIQTFEEVFGIAGDGSGRVVEQIHGGKLAADISALNKFTISGLLRAHAIRGDYESSLRVLAAVEGKPEFSIGGKKSSPWSGKGDPLNMLPDTRCYNIALAAAAKRGTKEGLSAAVEIYESMPDPSLSNPPLGTPAKNVVTFNTMIDAFANMGQFSNAQDVFKSLKNSPLQPDRVSYTTLIKASIKSGNLDRALDLLDDMKWIGISPDIVSYNSIIESLCNANKLFEAKDLVNEMETMRVNPDSMTYGLLMKGLLKSGKPGPCLTFFESACADERTAALTENVQLYTTAITAAAAMGDHERALDLVSRMNRAGVKPNKRTLTALIGACIAGKKYDAAADIFAKIKNPDGYAISVGLQALCFAGKFEEALELITEQRSGQKALKGKQVMDAYNKLMLEALHAGDYNIGRQTLSGLLGAGYIPSKITFNAMMEGLNLQADMPFTSRAMKQNSSDSHPPEEKFEFLLFVLDSLERRKLTVDSMFYCSILVFSAQAGGLQKRIASLITRSRKSGIQQKEISVSEVESTKEEASSQHIITSWEDLLENYSSYKKEEFSSVSFPLVRVSSKDFGRVLAAEQAVAYRGTTVAGAR